MSKARQFEKKWKNVYFDFETTHKDLIDEGYKNGVILYNIHHQDENGNWDNGNPDDKDQEANNKTGTHVKDFWEDICEYAFRTTGKLVLYAHNLFFDFNFVYKFLLRNNIVSITYDQNDTNGENGNKLYVFGNASKIYYARIGYKYKGRKLQFEFRDSMKFFASSLKTLCKSTPYVKHLAGEEEIVIQTPKTRVQDYPINFVRYCKRDTWIVRYIMEQLVDAVKSLKTWKKYHRLYGEKYKKWNYELSVLNDVYTISALSYKLMRIASTVYAWENKVDEWEEYQQLRDKKYQKQHGLKPKFKTIGEYFTKIPVSDWKKFREYFRGGYTQFSSMVEKGDFVLNPKMKNFSIDVNSAYPYWMTQPLPFGRPLLQPPTNGTYTKLLEIHIYKCKVKPRYEHLPTLYNNQRKKETENRYIKEWDSNEPYIVKMFECEWEALQKMYTFDDYKIVEETYYKTAPYLSEYYAEMYTVRKQYKKEKKDGLQLGIKTLLNAGYGTLGKRLEFDTTFFVDEHPYHLLETDPETGRPIFKTEINGKEKQYFVKMRSVEECKPFTASKKKIWKIPCDGEVKDDATFYFNDVASGFITANQRSLLFNTIASLPQGAIPLYCDTDSIYVANMTPEDFIKWCEEYCDSSTLGKWKVEHTNLLKFTAPKAKFYGLECDGKECCGTKQVVLKTSGLNLYMLEQQGITKEEFFEVYMKYIGEILNPDVITEDLRWKKFEEFLFDGLDYTYDDYGIVLVPRKLKEIKLFGVQ